eukprot:CFRG6722T1
MSFDPNPSAPDIPARYLATAVFLPGMVIILLWTLYGGIMHPGGSDIQEAYKYEFIASTWALFMAGFGGMGLLFLIAPPLVDINKSVVEWLSWLSLLSSVVVCMRQYETHGFDVNGERHAYVSFLSTTIFDCDGTITPHPTIKYVFEMSGTCPYDLEVILWQNVYQSVAMMLLPMTFLIPRDRRSLACLFNVIFIGSSALFLHIVPSVYYGMYIPGLVHSVLIGLPFSIFGVRMLYTSNLVSINHVILGCVVAGAAGQALVYYLPIVLFRENFINKAMEHSLILCVMCGIPLLSVLLTPTSNAVKYANHGGQLDNKEVGAGGDTKKDI